jgi:hypothetical protein
VHNTTAACQQEKVEQVYMYIKSKGGHSSSYDYHWIYIYKYSGRFYLLPKIHKENNSGRPIISANGHPTEKISEFIDFHLWLFVENLQFWKKRYLKSLSIAIQQLKQGYN